MNDPFQGTWTIDLAGSLVWDDSLKKHVPDEIGEEVITITVKDRMQDYEVLYGDRPKIRMGYTAPYDSTEWVPYTVREILSPSNGTEIAAEVEDFKKRIKASGGDRERRFEIGQPYALVRVINLDQRTQYRISRDHLNGQAQNSVLRRLAEDGRSMVSTVVDVEGLVFRIRKFVRID
ncbi:hypothetical protein [Arvimicrobium flavum]|uniref:hypothetical protein n=1 Tax=Arvimicrobium flavum TaxID=3393320 RepID=UPI00237ACB4A|nr:hypothetical protein [Mesorhizobium shangrilense]